MAKKQIELSTRRIEDASQRWLTASHLVVDWQGSRSLFYRMTKQELRKVLGGAEMAKTKSVLFDALPEAVSFGVRFTKTRLVIGCERFTAKDLEIMRKWAGAK